MPRLRNTHSGVVVNVDDATAARLWGKWKPVGEAEPQRKPKARPHSKKSD